MALVGARGMSEYISRSITMPSQSTNNFLSRNNMVFTDTSTFSAVFTAYCLNTQHSAYNTILHVGKSTGGDNSSIKIAMGYVNDVYATLSVVITNGSGQQTYKTYNINTIRYNTWSTVHIMCDLNSTSNIRFYVNGVESYNNGATANAGNTIPLSNADSIYVGGYNVNGTTWYSRAGLQGFMYYTTDYIDFSQEVNRNLFVNQLGYPRDVSKEIEAGTIPKPLIYLPFDDPTNLGKNLGTGGDFTVNGTVTPGADFKN